MSCSCCGMACIEIKYLYSINCTEPNEHNLDYLCKDGDAVKLIENHKYFTQCLMQIGVTKTKTAYFVVWTAHRMMIDKITFDKEPLESMSNFEMFYKTFIETPFLRGWCDLMCLTAVYSSRQVLCKTKTFLKEKMLVNI